MACCRKLTITLVSAQQLPDVRSFGEMKVYAQVTFNGMPKTLKETPTDKEGGTNPTWNFPIEYTLSESAIQNPGAAVVIRLFCRRTLGDKFVGRVNVPIKSLFDRGLRSDGIVWYEVAGKGGGTSGGGGRLLISYSFGDRTTVVQSAGPSTSTSSSGFIKAAGVMGLSLLVQGAAHVIFGDDSFCDFDGGGDDFGCGDDAMGDCGVVVADDEVFILDDACL